MCEDFPPETYLQDRTELSGPPAEDPQLDPFEDVEDGEPGEDMDGDHASALASAGFGTDEDYGCFGETEDGGWFNE